MTERIEILRKQSLDAINILSAERALLMTEFYKSEIAQEVSVPVRRALAFKYLLENKEICINEGELIVGERGPAPKATPTYPEISLHSLYDLKILDSREKVSFKVSDETFAAYRDVIIPFWKGKSNRDKIMAQVDQEWKDAYAAGMFTEFQEQRAPGHTVLGNNIYSRGLLDFKCEIAEEIAQLDFHNDADAFDKREQLRAMDISADAMILYAERHAEKLDDLAQNEQNAKRKAELAEMAQICRNIPANAPQTLHEAVQCYWFVHLGVITELNPWDSFNPGRLDQHLNPFYQKEIKEGKITKKEAVEILQSFWVKFNNHPAPPKMGVTAKESNTYTDFSLINVGGVKEDGSNAVNDMTYIILDVIEEMRLLQPSSMAQVSKKNPDRYIHRVLNITKTGFGQPSIFNTDAIIQELSAQGKTMADARNGGASGCVESGAFGTEAYWLTGYFNLTKMFELVLTNGFDNLTQKQIGPKNGKPEDFTNYEQVIEAFKMQVRHFAAIKIKANNIIERLFANNLPAPFLSLFIDDCIRKGKDYNNGGARYNTSYIQGVGLGSITDSLTSIKKHVFIDKSITMSEMLSALNANFEGYDDLRHELLFNTPKWGNDDDFADEEAVKVFDIFYDAVNGRSNTRGGHHRINMLPTTCHVYFGNVIGALPEGRLAKEPLSEGISPVQGNDRKGPTAVIKSASKIDQIKTGGTLLNQKLAPSFFDNEEGIPKLTSLIRSYFRLDGHHIQFNVVTVDTLLDAKKHPEKYRDLIVRVAGYSDYFNDLGEELQDEIIKRTAHEEF